MMRRTIIAATLALSVLALVAASNPSQLPLAPARLHQDPSFPQPASGLMDSTIHVPHNVGISLADALTLERKAGVWWGYARDVPRITARLQRLGGEKTTVFVPLDSAVTRMKQKPHFNHDGSETTDEEMQNNVDRFLSAHIVLGEAVLPTKGKVPTLLDGVEIEVVKVGEGWRVQPGNIDVVSVKEASNGKILYLDGVISF